ncbi:MAG TPA: Phenylacetic acid catabolic protein, partial [Gemmatimonadaceae bacterium]|nr:Phenylacetic acid catabolic protein [Gemmatimonadaceae bacterium]
ATDELDAELATRGIAPELGALQGAWREQVAEVITAATLTLPADRTPMRDGRRGIHTEHLGHMLAEMQSVARAHPGATW